MYPLSIQANGRWLVKPSPRKIRISVLVGRNRHRTMVVVVVLVVLVVLFVLVVLVFFTRLGEAGQWPWTSCDMRAIGG